MAINLVNEQKYLHDQMVKAQTTGNKGLATWVNNQRKELGLSPNGALPKGYVSPVNNAISQSSSASVVTNQSNNYNANPATSQGVATQQQQTQAPTNSFEQTLDKITPMPVQEIKSGSTMDGIVGIAVGLLFISFITGLFD